MRNLILLAIVAVLLASTFFWWQSQERFDGGHSAADGVAYAQTTNGLLLPHVVVAATKLGQGRAAIQGLPTTTEFEWPLLRESNAGAALLISGAGLPARTEQKVIKPLNALPAGADRQLKFDAYSWSLGTLMATTPQWIDLPADASAKSFGIPEAVFRAARAAPTSQRLLLLIPPRQASTERDPASLDPLDAYVVVADIRVAAP